MMCWKMFLEFNSVLNWKKKINKIKFIEIYLVYWIIK